MPAPGGGSASWNRFFHAGRCAHLLQEARHVRQVLSPKNATWLICSWSIEADEVYTLETRYPEAVAIDHPWPVY